MGPTLRVLDTKLSILLVLTRFYLGPRNLGFLGFLGLFSFFDFLNKWSLRQDQFGYK